MLKQFYQSFRNESGVTLIEAIALILIIAITAGPLSRLAITNLKSNTQSMQIGEVVSYAEGSMEEVISIARNLGVDEIMYEYDFSFDIPGKLTRSLTVTQTDYDGIPYAQVTLTVSDGNDISYSLTTLLRVS